MAEVRDVAWADIETPPARPVTSLGQVSPPSRESFAYATGTITGGSLSYPDLWSFAWYLPLISDPDDRVRSAIAETAGDVLVGVRAVDVSAGEAFLLRDLQLGEPLPFASAIARDQPMYVFYPRRRHMSDELDDFAYETKLARLGRTYPPSIRVRAGETGVEIGEYEPGLTAGEWLEWIFEQWTAAYPWFTYKPVPELYLRRASADYTDDRGVVFAEAFDFEQSSDAPRSMRNLIDAFLEIFDGHTLRVDSDNDLEIVPPHWSPAYTGGTLALDWHDLVNLPEPEQDAEGVVNQATVRSQGMEFVEDTEIMVPGCTKRRHEGGPSIDCDNGFQKLTDTDGVGEAANYQDWPVDEDVLPGTGTLEITVAAEVGARRNTDGGTLAIVDGPNLDPASPWQLPMDGHWHDVGEVTATALLTAMGHTTEGRVKIRAQYLADQRVVVLQYSEVALNTGAFGTTARAWWSFMLSLNGAGPAWARSDTVNTGTYGEGDVAPGLQESRDQFGVVERVIRSDLFQLSVAQCLEVAEGIVINNLAPVRRYRELEQSYWRALPVRPAHVGRLVSLPNGDVGTVEGLTYMDDFAYDSAALRGTFTLVVTDHLIDPVIAWLANPDGSLWLNPDGSLSPTP